MNNNSQTTQTASKQVILSLEVNSKDAINAIVKARERIDELKAAKKSLDEEYKNGNKSTEEYRKELTVLNAAMKDCNSVIRANEKALQDNIQQQKSQSGSLKEMRAELKQLRSSYESLSKADREGIAGQDQLKRINQLTDELKNLEKAQGDYTREVGHYENAAKPARQALRELTVEIQNMAVGLSQSKSEIKAQEQVVNSLANTVGKDSDAYKEAKQKLDDLNKAYNDASIAMSKMEQQAGEMRDTISDAGDRIRSFANDQQKLVAMQQGIGILTSSYTLLQSSMAALGLQSEELINVYAKVQLVQQSVNSLMTIYKALNKDSTLMIVARTAIEKARTAYTEAYNVALAKQNALTATDTTLTTADTAAHWSLAASVRGVTAAIAANPIGAIILAVTAAVTGLIAVVKKLSNANKKAIEEQKRTDELFKNSVKSYRDSIKEGTKAVDSLSKNYTGQINRVKALVAILKNETASYKEKKKALDELNRIVPSYNGSIDKTGKIIRSNSTAIDEYIKKLSEQAKAEAQYQQLVTAYQEQSSLQRQKLIAEGDKAYYEKMMKQHQDILDVAKETRNYELEVQAQKNVDYFTKNYEKVVETLKNVNNELKTANRNVQVAESLITQAPTSTQSTQPTQKTQKEDKEEISEAKKKYDELLKLAQKYSEELQDVGKTATEKENSRFEAEKKILEDAIKSAEDMPSDPNIDPKKLSDTITQLQDYLKTITQIHKDNLEKIKQDTENAFADITNKLAELPEGQLQQLRVQLEQELAALKTEEQQVLASHEFTEDQKTEISRLYAEKRSSIVKKEAKNEKDLYIRASMDIANAISGTLGNLSDMFSTLAENNAQMTKFSKAMAMGQIVISSAVAMAQAVVTAINAGKDTGLGAVVTVPLVLAEMLGIVGSMIAQAKRTLASSEEPNKPKFADGGLVTGPGTGTSDSIDAKLSNGEYVLNARAVQRVGAENLDAINYRGASLQTLQTADGNIELMKAAFKEVVSEIQPVVSVKEITNKQNRVRVKES